MGNKQQDSNRQRADVVAMNITNKVKLKEIVSKLEDLKFEADGCVELMDTETNGDYDIYNQLGEVISTIEVMLEAD